jgi:2-succinyl-5-enolpyruvyl-6-hydroxy-3-cyclohexene-1-carboxylate synthase
VELRLGIEILQPSLRAMSGTAAVRALEACLNRGVREFVVCAGARNVPLVLAVARSRDLKVWNHFEERGAGFFALGRVRACGRPVAVVTTSGTAVAELLPAVIEAHYQGRPLLVVSADRPRSYRGSGAPQAIEQVGLFGDYVEGMDDLGGAADSLGIESQWSGLRPWHLNVCLEEEEEVPDLVVPAEEPEPARLPRTGVTELVEFLNKDSFRGVVVLLGGLEPEEREETCHVLKELGAPVVAEATSGLREALGKLVLTDGDRVLRAQPPGKVLRLGDVPVGRFWRDLESLPATEVLSVTRTGFSGLARESTVLKGLVHDVFKGMGGVPSIGDVLDLSRAAAKRRGRLEELLERYPDSEPALVRVLSTYATMGESVFLGNSLPIREWNLCAQVVAPIVEVQASRGANGIDGQLSAWLGATAGQDGGWGVFGDLTVLYDLAAPAWLAQVGGEGRVLAVINNSGGRIFERLPRLHDLEAGERALMANAHTLHFGQWAAMWGMDHLVVTDRDGFDVEPGPVPLVVEIRPDEGQTAAFWEAWEE